MIDYYVSKTDSGENHFPTIRQAVAQVPDYTMEPVIIHLAPGTYHEKVTIARPFLTLEGAGPASTVISYDDCATQILKDGSKRGTFRSYTLFVDGHDITLRNLTVKNASFPRQKAGQAIALYADGDRIQAENCRFESFQDTLFTGPLPPAALSPGGFTGPKEFAERIVGRQYYKNCYICGDIDFIFGSATAYFEECEIASVYSEPPAPDAEGTPPVYGYVTAASTPEGYPYGYVFDRCRFTGICPEKSVYLGRPWRNFAKTVLIDCELGGHIRREGFHDWNKKEAHGTLFYAEYRSFGEGAAPSARAPFVRQLSDEEAQKFRREAVLSGKDGWRPSI